MPYYIVMEEFTIFVKGSTSFPDYPRDVPIDFLLDGFYGDSRCKPLVVLGTGVLEPFRILEFH